MYNTLHGIITLFLLTVSLVFSGAAPVCAASGYHLVPSGYGGGGRFTCVAIAPDAQNRIYVGSDVAGFFASENGGKAFTPLGKDLGSLAVAAIAVPPGQPDHLFVLGDDGLYYSTDRGRNLKLLSSRIRYEGRFFGSNLILFTPDNTLYVASDIDGVYKLSPASETSGQWTIEPLLGLGGYAVNGLAYAKGQLFAATEDGVYRWDRDYWDNISDGLSFMHDNVVDITTLPDETVVLAELDQGAFLWDDGEDSWKSIGPNTNKLPAKGPVQFKAICAQPGATDTIFLATHPTYWPYLLLRTSDKGKDWQVITRFALSSTTTNWASGLQAMESLAFAPSGNTGFLLDWWNVWRTSDGGLSWIQIDNGLQNTVVNDIAIQPGHPESIFLAVADNGLMVSEDGGASWNRSMQGIPDGHARALAFSPRDPNKLYLLMDPWNKENGDENTYFHLYKSTDAGHTWTHFPIREHPRKQTLPYVDGLPGSIVLHPHDDDVVYIGVNGYGIYKLDTGAPLRDGVARAENIASSLQTPYIKGPSAILMHPEDPNILFAAVHDTGIFKTTDGGAHWNKLPNTEGFVFGLAMDPDNPDRLLAAVSDGILQSQDGGATWRHHNLPFTPSPNMAVNAVAYGPEGRIYAGVAGFNNKAGAGVFVSEDNARSFVKAEFQAANVGVNVLRALPHAPEKAYVGFNGLGLFTLEPLH